MHPAELGHRIRVLRRRQGRTLEDVATGAGFTRSLLSKIETGQVSPPVATLARIGKSLGVDLGDLLGGNSTQPVVHEAWDAVIGSDLATTEKGYKFHVYAAGKAGKLMQPFLFIARRGEVAPGPLSHNGDEFIHVLKGRMRFTVGPTTHHLGPGDSVYFDAEQPHDLEPTTPEVTYLAVFVQPGHAEDHAPSCEMKKPSASSA